MSIVLVYTSTIVTYNLLQYSIAFPILLLPTITTTKNKIELD